MIKQWGEWLNAKQFHASIVAFICMMASIIYLPGTFVASIVLAFTTLRNGAKFGLGVLAWLAIPAIALGFEGELSLFAIAWIHCLIIFVLALTLRQTHCWNNVLLVMTVFFIVFIALIHFIVPDVGFEWHKLLLQFMQNWVAQGQSEPNYWPTIVTFFMKCGTGFIAFFLMTCMLLQLMIARFWQSIIYNPGAFKREILKIRINRWVSLLLPLMLIMSITTQNDVLTDMLPIIVFVFMVAGLVVVHTIALAKPQMRFVVPVVYIATFLFIYPIGLLALVGFLDAWIEFPSRVKAFELLNKGEN